jgi:hypothetical protein
MADKKSQDAYYQLTMMKIGEEIWLETIMADTSLIVRRVPNGWLYTIIRSDYDLDDGHAIRRSMTTTFVPRQIG